MGLNFLSTEKKREVEVIVNSTTMNLRSLARIVFHVDNPTRKMDMRKIFSIELKPIIAWHYERSQCPVLHIITSASLSKMCAFIQSTQGPAESDHFPEVESFRALITVAASVRSLRACSISPSR
jgi:hypothetical protein